MPRFQSEQERKEFQQQHIADLTAKSNDRNLTDKQRQNYRQMLSDCIEDQKVEMLFEAVSQNPNPEISAGATHLVKMFMREHETIETPENFYNWLYSKPRFK